MEDIPPVRIKTGGREYALLNIPNTTDGVGMVLYLVQNYPGGSALTDRACGSPYCLFGKISEVCDPKEGWITIPDTDQKDGDFKNISVKTGRHLSGAPRASHASYYTHPDARSSLSSDGDKPKIPPEPDELVTIVNIPDDAVGRTFLMELLRSYSGSDLRAYALTTQDFGVYPVKLLANANLPR